jgi:methylenetetrahydrofolate reductase (NADPH)
VRIADAYGSGRPVFSFEFFPPHTPAGGRSLLRTLGDLRKLEPDFVSVTYPLQRERRHLTLEIVADIKRDLGIEAMAHLTCVDASRDEIRAILERLDSDGIENVLALGGDPPPDDQIAVPRHEWFRYASDLAAFIRANFAFCLGGAAHPEKHPRSPDFDTDVRNLRPKVEAGCEFLITQLFFDNEDYFRLVQKARAIGIEVPIVPGIMPVTNVAGIKRMCAVNESRIPDELLEELEAVADDPARVGRIGIRYAERQCRELLERGAPGIHFYTLNRSTATREVLNSLRPSGGRRG